MYFLDLLQKQQLKIFLLVVGALCSSLAALAQDYGDAPTSYGSPSHGIVSSLYIGSTAPDNEGVALPTTNANGDNVRNVNDENTFTSFPALTVNNTTYTISNIPVFNNTGSTARLTAWIDFNRNGAFDANEGIQSAAIASGASATTTSLTWTNIGTSPDISPGKSFIRFRLTTNTNLTTSTPGSTATDGEVEDYVLTIGTVSNTNCASTGTSSTTLSFQNPTLIEGTALTVGAVYRFPQVTTGVDALVRINALVNTTITNIDNTTVASGPVGDASALQPSLSFSTNPIPTDPYAEFQVSFVAEGTTTSFVQFTSINATAVDIDGDGSSTLREYQEFPNLPSYILNGSTNILVSNNGNFKRFYPSSNANQPGISVSTVTNAATGVFNNISTFTYRAGATLLDANSSRAYPRYYSLDFQCIGYTGPVTTTVNNRDYGDAPNTYGTLAASSGASHIYTDNLKLGVEGGDTEPDGFSDGTQSSTLAQDDDQKGTISGGDEASVDFIRTLYTNSTSYSIAVTASNNTGSSANLRAWLDFNRNGVFEAGEASALVTVPTGVTNQQYVVTWSGLTSLSAGQSFLRVRLATATLNTNEATGAKSDGEVEDYAVTINTGNPPVSIAGTVYNDANGINNSALDGTGTNASGPLYALLIGGSSGNLVASSLVQADGSYIFNNETAGTYTVRLSTTAGTVGSAAPAASLPSGWVNTAEAVAPAFNDGTVDGNLLITVGTTDFAGANFGIEQLPSPGSGTATVANAGGTNAVTVPPTAFTTTAASTDTAPGSVTAIRLTVFPSNTTSLTINGTAYASLPTGGIVVPTTSAGAPTVPILVDPTNDNSPVSFTFVAVDNASKESTTTGTAVINFPLSILVSGTVWNDADGNLSLNGSETGTNAGGPLYVNLVSANNTVTVSTTVSAAGSYTLTGVPASTTGLKLVLSTSATATTPGPLPTGWVNTGESVGATNTSIQSTTLGQIELTTGTGAITAQNFGIEQLPTPGSGSATVVNTGGTSAVTVPPTAFTSTTPSTDTAPGSVTAIRLTAFPSNTTSLTVNGSVYTSLPTGGIVVATTGSGAPTVAILVDPANDSNPVNFTFVAVDNAGKESSTTGTAVINSTLVTTLSGTVWNDADGNLALNGAETGTNAGGPLFVNLVNASNAVVASTTVTTTGTYSLSGVPANTSGLRLVLTSTASSTAPGGLPTGWVNTGEVAGTNNSATQTTVLGQIELTTTTAAVSGANFGIEQVPSAGSGTATVVNTGGTSGVTVPPAAFTSTAASTDTAPGSVTAIRITAFPTNTTSLTVNGSVYSATNFPSNGIVVATTSSGAPTISILVDPTNDSNPVSLAFVAIDNAGKESTTTGTAVISSSLVLTVSGTVWNDADGNLALNGTESGTNAGGPLYVNLVSASNAVVATASVNANGTYTLSGVPASTTGLKLVLTNSATATSPGGLPGGWVNTGESVGSGNSATQSAALGQIELTTGTVAITAQNFGIEQVPSAGSGTATVVNTGGTSGVTVPPAAFTSTAASTDTAPGSVTAIRITAFPTNTTSLSINGTVYTSLPTSGIVVPTDASGAPTVSILVDPTNDSNPVSLAFVAIDNAGKESTTTGTAVISSSLVLTVSGQVWNDADGSISLNNSEAGTNAGGPLYVNLVSASNAVLTSTTVSSTGSYTLVGVPASTTGLKLVLTNSATATGPGGLPGGWVNTGESIGTTNTATQSTTLGQIELTTGTVAITAQNFGIEQVPSAGSGTATVVNTGGSSGVSVPASAFTSVSASTDTAPGSVTAIRITAFPTNTTSLTVNGTVYTSLPTSGIVVATASTGAPTVSILVDPTNDSNPVVFSFVAIDNAGKESTTTGTAVISSSLVLIVSGTIWNDADGNLALNGTESGTNAGGLLYVNLVNSSNAVLATTGVAADGSYSLSGVPANTSGLRLVLTSTASSTAPGGLPTGWVNTGESVGSGNSATQSSVLGQIELTTGTVAITAQNFGIEQVPSAGSGTATVVNTGGSSGVSVPASAFTSTVASTDTAPGSVTAIRITAFPTNTTSLSINGSVYSATSFPSSGVVVATDGSGAPTVSILVDPTNDSNPVSFAFVAIDNAGKESTTTGTAVISSSLVLTVSGTVWNDADGNLALNGTETGTNAGGPLYVNLVSASNAVIATTSVNANGTYTLSGVPASTTGLKLVLAATASSTSPGGLPGGWVNTGESVGSGNSATQSAVLGQIELTTGTVAIIAQNFGIEQVPSAGSGTATVVNTGGTSGVTVPPAAFTSTAASTDTAPGSVTAIRITAFPTNTTSLSINGSVYSATNFPSNGIVVATDGSGAPTISILVDPTNDSNPVSLAFVAIDNAGKESTTTGTAVISSSLVLTVSGQVWNDADGSISLNNSETGTNAGGPLYVNLVSASNAVLTSTTVSSTGSYTLVGVPASTTGLKLVLTNSATATGPGGLPGGWVNTGESIGTTNTATQSTTLGQIELTTGTVAITAQNFGIEQVPSAGSGTATVVNTGGTSGVTVPPAAFTTTAASTDTAPGSVTAIRITAFPTNTTSLSINGSVYSATNFPSNGIVVATNSSGAPTISILVDPTNDSNPVSLAFVAIDNAGKESTTTGTAVISSSLVLTVSGTVWNDADGSISLNNSETGTNAGGPLYVNLVNSSNAVLATASVGADGSYTLVGVPASTTDLRLVLTNSASSTAPGGLPTGWVNTGESVGSGNPATQSSVLGQIELTTGTVAITAQNFGIEQVPSAGSGTATVVNTGGTSGVTVPPAAFTTTAASTDTAPGSVTAIRITAFPTNTTSLSINGTVYTSLPTSGIVVPTDASGAPTVSILVDPTNDSNPVSLAFVAIDNAGKESTTTGTAVISSSLVLTVSGTVWNDADGSISLNNSETGTNAGGPLYVNLVNSSNAVVATASVNANGSYSLRGVPASTTDLRLVLTNSASSTAVGGLPTNWVNTGESVGSGNSATQSTTLGQIELTTGTVAIIAQNFGIEQVPSAGSGTATVVNTGGSSGVSVPASAFTSVSASTDTAPGSVTAIRITAFPTNTTSLSINGSVYSAASFPGNGVVVATDGSGAPTVSILVDPTNDSNPVSLAFVAIDNAGKESTTTGTAVISSSLVLTVSGTVWNDADGNLALNGAESGTNAGGPLYVNLVNSSNAVLATSSVGADGSYTLVGVPASTTDLRLVLTNSASSTTVGGLPTNWVNTGESVGSGNPATQSSVLGQIELTTGTSAIIAQNFGIEQVPSAGSGTATVVNTGGSSGVSVPASAFTSVSASTDTAPGSVTAIRITAFPTNTTSLSINGSVYSATNFPSNGIVVATDGSGAPTISILVDPTNDSNPVSLAFVAIDNAGKESTTTGTAVISSSLVLTVSGTVWNDADGNLALNGGESGTNAGGPLYVNLVNSSNAVLATASVGADGSYTLVGVPASTTDLRLVLTNLASSTAVGGLPTNWVNTGESVGSGNPATQSSVLGQIELTTGTVAITAQNFGIEQVPSAGSGTATVVNTGGTSGVTVPPAAFTSTVASTDTAPGSVTAIRITAFPTNTTSLSINGSVYSATNFPSNGIVVATDGSGAPTVSILVDPTNDSNPVSLAFVAIDNAGKESTTTGTAVISSSLVLTVSGQVWNDADGSISLNNSETGTNAGGPLYVNLVNSSNAVIATASVNANGSYSLRGVPASTTDLRLVLTNSASSTAVGGLPTGWVNTGESVGSGNPATQSSVLGQIELTTGTVAIIAQNFGIEQLPTPGSGTVTVVNTGGSSGVSVPALAFTSTAASTDTAPGSVTAIRITAFPTNTTSLTINGTTYTSLPTSGIVVPTDANGAPTVSILVDPTDDNSPVSLAFVAIDNAGKESTTTGTAVINFNPTITVSGQVWNDIDGNLALNGTEAGTNAGGPLFVNLVDGSNTVVATTSVNANGSYTLVGVPASTTDLRLVLTNSANSTAVGGLPTNWVNTGESVGSGNLATQSTTLGQIELTTGTGAITAQNFGIRQLPTPGSGSVTVVNLGGTSAVSVPATAFTNTSTALGSVAFRIRSFPSNVTSLTINGTVYTSLPADGIVVPTDANGAPTVSILVDPTDDNSPVSFSFVAIDNAGKESTTTGTAVINFSPTITVSGSVWDDADGNLALNGTESGTNAGGPLYVNLVNSSNAVVATTSVNANGSYTLRGVPASSTDLRLVLTNSASSTAVGDLPAGWVNTGESVGSGNPATQSSVLGQIELTTGTGAIIAQNFGIELLPSPGSGSVAANNGGGTKPVSVPTSAFTNIVASTDTAPGSVTAIRLTAFPTNTTSLTVNGSVYTSLPTGGIILPTNANGSPTVPVLVDPRNDGAAVVLVFVAVDNAGKESVTTGTATLRAVSDLTPIIYARPSTVRKAAPVTVVVDVLELLNVATSGPITVRVSKDALVELGFNASANKVDNRDVQNSLWSFDGTSDANYYIFRTNAVVGAGDQLSFGLTGTLTPGATSGTLTISVVISGGSGSEVRLINNTDADKIDYFQR